MNKRTLTFHLSWLVWMLAALFYGYEFMQRVSLSVMTTPIMADFKVSAALLGLMSSFYYYAYAAMQIPAGVLVDRFGSRRLLLVGTVLVAAGTALLASVDHIALGCIARLLTGLGSAVAFVSVLKLIVEWFPPVRFAIMAGLTNLLGYAGASFGGAPLGALVTHFGWRHALLGTAVFGVLLFALIWLFVRDRPPKPGHRHYPEEMPAKTLLKGLKSVLRRPQSWINAAFAGLMVLPTSTFAALWGVPYLVHVDKLTHDVAAGAVSSIFIGVAVGSPIFGWISDRIKKRRPPLIIAAIGALTVTLVLLYGGSIPIWMIYALCFLFGFFQSSHVLNFAIASEINRPAASGAAIGFTNMAVMVGGAIFQPVVGALLDIGWSGKMIEGVAQYSISDYHWSLAVLPVCQLFAIIIAIFFLKDTFCKRLAPKGKPSKSAGVVI